IVGDVVFEADLSPIRPPPPGRTARDIILRCFDTSVEVRNFSLVSGGVVLQLRAFSCGVYPSLQAAVFVSSKCMCASGRSQTPFDQTVGVVIKSGSIPLSVSSAFKVSACTVPIFSWQGTRSGNTHKFANGIVFEAMGAAIGFNTPCEVHQIAIVVLPIE